MFLGRILGRVYWKGRSALREFTEANQQSTKSQVTARESASYLEPAPVMGAAGSEPCGSRRSPARVRAPWLGILQTQPQDSPGPLHGTPTRKQSPCPWLISFESGQIGKFLPTPPFFLTKKAFFVSFQTAFHTLLAYIPACHFCCLILKGGGHK